MALSVAEALVRILDGAAPTEPETVPIGDAHGRILAHPLNALLTQPPFASSAMDGYAVRATDVAGLPAELAVIGEAAAGHPFSGAVGEGQAVRIFTGAPVPAGADAVVIQENTRKGARDGTVDVIAGTPDSSHIRPRGIDFQAGSQLLAAGRKLGARELSLAAAMGHGSIDVRRRPTVAVIATGDELVLPGEVPGPGQIVCSNHLGVLALCREAGAAARFIGIARDTTGSLDARIAEAANDDLLITIGGASVGDHDLVGPVLRSRGMELDFWKIAMRPGKPLMFGRLGPQRVIGLPGNPVSSLICTRIFAVPLLSALLGRPVSAENEATARTSVSIEANGPRQHYMRAKLERAPDGQDTVNPVRSQDSSLLSPLAEANVLIVRPPHAAAVTAGAPVPVLRLDF